MNRKNRVPGDGDTGNGNTVTDKPFIITKKNNKKLSLAVIDDKISLMQVSLCRLRLDIRNIINEEIKNVIRDEIVRQRGYQ